MSCHPPGIHPNSLRRQFPKAEPWEWTPVQKGLEGAVLKWTRAVLRGIPMGKSNGPSWGTDKCSPEWWGSEENRGKEFPGPQIPFLLPLGLLLLFSIGQLTTWLGTDTENYSLFTPNSCLTGCLCYSTILSLKYRPCCPLHTHTLRSLQSVTSWAGQEAQLSGRDGAPLCTPSH